MYNVHLCAMIFVYLRTRATPNYPRKPSTHHPQLPPHLKAHHINPINTTTAQPNLTKSSSTTIMSVKRKHATSPSELPNHSFQSLKRVKGNEHIEVNKVDQTPSQTLTGVPDIPVEDDKLKALFSIMCIKKPNRD